MSEQRQPAADAVPGFQTASAAWARRYGLRGRLSIELRPEGLSCDGQNGGHLLIDASQVDCLRSVAESSKHGAFFTTRIWVQGGPQPAVIVVPGSDSLGYIHTIGHFAHRVATLGGLERLERGSSVAGALTLVLAMLPVLLGGLLVSIYSLANDPWYQRFAPTFVGLVIFLGVGWAALIARPRRVRDWNEYLIALQGLKGQRA